MNNNDRQNLMSSQISSAHFNYAVNEVKERLKICNVLGIFIDDISDIENNIGKAFSKAGSQSSIFSKVEAQTIGGNVSILWEQTYKQFTSQNFKQHTNLQANLSQNIGKSFPDSTKALKKTVKALSSSLSIVCEDFRKSKASYRKNHDKYNRMVMDVECVIRSKNTALASLSVDSSQQNNSSGNDDNFMNLSLTKMLGKAPPNEKKLIEKCRDAVREFDAYEKQIQASYQKLSESHAYVEQEIKRALDELNNVEISRYLLMKEGLSRLFIAEDLMIERLYETYNCIMQQLDTLKPSSTSSLLPEVSSIQTMLDHDIHGANDDTILSNYTSIIEKLLDIIDFFKSLSSFIRMFIYDIYEARKAYIKHMQKILDKHGFSKSAIPASSSAHMRAASMMVASISKSSSSSLCADIISSNESPSMRVVWEAIARAMGGFAEMHNKIADMMIDRICHPIDIIIKELDDHRRELHEKMMYHNKRIQAGHMNVNRIFQKLMKVKKDIIDRKTMIKKARDDEPSPSSNIVHDDNRDKDSTRSSSPPTELSSSSKMSSSLRSTSSSLSVAVGLESTADRINRIEHKITSLEEEESSLQESLDHTKHGLTIIYDDMKHALSPSISSSSAMMMRDVEVIYDHVGNMMLLEKEGIEMMKQSMVEARECYDMVDMDRDMMYMMKLIQAAARAAEDDHDDDVYHLDIMMMDEFIPYHSDTIIYERRLYNNRTNSNPPVYETIMPPSSSASSSSSSSAALLLDNAVSNDANMTMIHDDDDDDDDDDNDTAVDLPTIYPDPYESISSSSSSTMMMNPDNNHDDASSSATSSPSPPSSAKHGSSPSSSSSKAHNTPTRTSSSSSSHDNLISTRATAPATTMTPSSPPSASYMSSSLSSMISSSSSMPVAAAAAVKDSADVSELNKFGLSSMDKVLESYSCALYPKKGMLTHGRMYVTQYFLVFSGWPDTRVLLPLVDVNHLEKSNTLIYVPNAIIVHMNDEEEYFFASFLDRDTCYNLLVRINEVARRLYDLHGPNQHVVGRGLTFGFQSNFTSLSGNPTAGALMNALTGSNYNTTSDVSTAITASPVKQVLSSSPTSSSSSMSMISPLMASTSSSMSISTNIPEISNSMKSSASASSTININAPIPSASTSPSSSSKQSIVSQSQPTPLIINASKHDIKIQHLFNKHSIMLLGDYNYPATAPATLYQRFWQHKDAYMTFLSSLGDFDISMTEWMPYQPPPSSSCVAEDILKLPYQYTRDCQYLHPRTTFLMFGPKNATGVQKQYLYLTPGDDGASSTLSLSSHYPWQGVIMTVTELQGPPMCDMFRVVVYWTFEPSPPPSSSSSSSLSVKVGMNVHMLKSTLFKGQIITGTKEELDEQVKRWHDYIPHILASSSNGIISSSDMMMSSTGDDNMMVADRNDEGGMMIDAKSSPRARRRSSRLEAIDHHQLSSSQPSSSLEIMLPRSRLYAIIIVCLAIIWYQYRASTSYHDQMHDITRRMKAMEDNLLTRSKTQDKILKHIGMH